MNSQDRHVIVTRVSQEWAEAGLRKIYNDGDLDLSDPRVKDTLRKMQKNYYAFGIRLMLEVERIMRG